MNVVLSPELEQFVTDQVVSGLYHSPGEVVRDGLHLLEAQNRLRTERMHELQAKLAVGLKQIEDGNLVDAEQVFSRLEEKARALGVVAP